MHFEADHEYFSIGIALDRQGIPFSAVKMNFKERIPLSVIFIQTKKKKKRKEEAVLSVELTNDIQFRSLHNMNAPQCASNL